VDFMRNALTVLATAAAIIAAAGLPNATHAAGLQLAADFPPGSIGEGGAPPPYYGVPGAPDQQFEPPPTPPYRGPGYSERAPDYRDHRYAEPRPDDRGDGRYAQPQPDYRADPRYPDARPDYRDRRYAEPRPEYRDDRRYAEPQPDDRGDPGYAESRPDYREPPGDQQRFYDRGPRYSGPDPVLRPPAPIYGAPACDWQGRQPYWDGYRWIQPQARGC
jgi:hypothetical protein